MGDSQRDAQDCIRPEPRLVWRAVEFDHDAIDFELIRGAAANQFRRDLRVDILGRAADSLAAITLRVAVAEFDSLMFAGAGARRHDRPSHRSVGAVHLDLDRWRAAAIEDFAGMNAGYFIIH